MTGSALIVLGQVLVIIGLLTFAIDIGMNGRTGQWTGWGLIFLLTGIIMIGVSP